MQVNGKLVTIVLLVVAVAAASYAWWFQFSRGQRALEYWQGNNAAVIRHGDRAELLVLAEPAESIEAAAVDRLTIDGRDYAIVQRATLDQAPGFVHARHALIDDASYLWEKPLPEKIAWSHALKFENKAGEAVTVVIDLEAGWLLRIDRDRPLAMDEILQSGLKQFFAEHLRDAPVK